VLGVRLALLTKACSHRVLIGQSLDGMIAQIAATNYDISEVVRLSTPYDSSAGKRLLKRLQLLMRPMIFSTSSELIY
jgi:esterase/lipase